MLISSLVSIDITLLQPALSKSSRVSQSCEISVDTVSKSKSREQELDRSFSPADEPLPDLAVDLVLLLPMKIAEFMQYAQVRVFAVAISNESNEVQGSTVFLLASMSPEAATRWGLMAPVIESIELVSSIRSILSFGWIQALADSSAMVWNVFGMSSGGKKSLDRRGAASSSNEVFWVSFSSSEAADKGDNTASFGWNC